MNKALSNTHLSDLISITSQDTECSLVCFHSNINGAEMWVLWSDRERVLSQGERINCTICILKMVRMNDFYGILSEFYGILNFV